MDEKLTNEAAEMIGSYAKGGKKETLSLLLKFGGIVRKSIEPYSGRKPGFERVRYYYSNGFYACYDPARAKAVKRHKKTKIE